MSVQPRFIPSVGGPVMAGPADVVAWAREVAWSVDQVFAIHLHGGRFGCFASVDPPCGLADVVDEPDWLLETAQSCAAPAVVVVVLVASRRAIPTAADRDCWRELEVRHELAGVRLLDVVLVDGCQDWSLAFEAPARSQRYPRC